MPEGVIECMCAEVALWFMQGELEMKIEVVAMGKVKEKHCKALVADYVGRLKHYIPFKETSLRESKLTAQNREEGLREEAQSFEKCCTPNTIRIAMDERGKQMTSVELAQLIEQWMTQGTRHVAFFIGSASGLDEEFREGCQHVLALSKMTLPHEVARVILTEQLYRSMTIIRGEPYHK